MTESSGAARGGRLRARQRAPLHARKRYRPPRARSQSAPELHRRLHVPKRRRGPARGGVVQPDSRGQFALHQRALSLTKGTLPIRVAARGVRGAFGANMSVNEPTPLTLPDAVIDEGTAVPQDLMARC